MALDPITAGFDFGGKVLGVVSEWVEDKDLALKISLEIQKLSQDFSLQVLNTQTNPFIDGAVKLAYASRDVFIPLLRPIGSAALTAFGLYAHQQGMQIDPLVHGMLDSAFPGWMGMREVGKHREVKAKIRKEEVRAMSGKEPESDDFDWGE